MTARTAALCAAFTVLASGLAVAEGAAVAWQHAREEARARTFPVELSRVPESDQGIDFQHPLPGPLYPLISLSTGQRILDHGQQVYLDAQGMRAYPSPTPFPTPSAV